MSRKSNVAVIAAFLAVLAAPAHANNGDIGLPDRGQEGSRSAQPSAATARATRPTDTRRQLRVSNSKSSPPTYDFSLLGHN